MITTHVLDIARGRPAAGVPVILERATSEAWELVGAGVTDADGRLEPLAAPPRAGRYRLTFDTGAFHPDGFYPEIVVTFTVREPGEHHHVPLLLSPHGYTTYRGS